MSRLPLCLILAALTTTLFGQSAVVSKMEPLKFDAADVHSSAKKRNPFPQGPYVRPGRYEIRDSTMVDLISKAYGVDADDVWGGPNWIEMDRFDIVAKTEGSPKPDAQKAMLQTLLAERFKLVVHNDVKPMPAFSMVVGKHPQLKKSEGEATNTGCQISVQGLDGSPAGPNTAVPVLVDTCHHMTMKSFAERMRDLPLSDQYLNRAPVIDKTELEGEWDFTLKYTLPGRNVSPSDVITLPDAMEKQLGLKLEATKIPLPVVMVDSAIQTPTPNIPNIAEALGTAAIPTEFEVAIIKPTDPSVKGVRFQIQPGGKVNIQGAPLKLIIQQCWNVTDELMANAPSWLGDERYDITAKAPAAALLAPTGNGGNNNGPPVDFETVIAMLKGLITDRFQFKMHMEDRPISAYTLIAPKPKMKKADPNSRTRFKEGPAAADPKNDPRNKMPVLGRLVSVQNMTMAQFADQLQNIAPGYIHSPVLDSTGLTGTYDFTLSFSPAGAFQGGGGGGGRGGDGAAAPGAPAGDGQAADPTGAISLFEAVDKQLGLKLELVKRPVAVLVIDHIERKPTEN